MAKTNLKKEINFRLKLRNGNIVTGKSDLKIINFNTKYGDLNLPIHDLESIEFGIISSKKIEQKVEALVDILESENEATCKKTFESLIACEAEAIPVLSCLLEDDNSLFEQYSVEAALIFLKDKHGVTDFIENDVIKLRDDYSFPGITDIKEIKLNTSFGDLLIPRGSIIDLEVNLPFNNKGNRSFKLEANQHVSANASNGWLKTNIKLKAGQKFTISSKGEVVMASLSNQTHKPSGSYLPPNGSWTAGNDNAPNGNPIFGNVVYKIGQQGPMLKAGTKVDGVAAQAGVLFLSIYETVFNGAYSSHYSVSVKV